MPGPLRQVETTRDLEFAREVLREYEIYLRAHHPTASLKNELESLPGPYAPPDGRLFLIVSEGTTVGCAAFRRLEEPICEMRRLYIMPSHRRQGLGRRAATTLMQEAGRIGYTKMRLLTLPFMWEAEALYRSLGFREMLPYRPTTAPDAVFMEAELANQGNQPGKSRPPLR